MIGETGERKSAVATPDGKSRKKNKKNVFASYFTLYNISVITNGSGTLKEEIKQKSPVQLSK